MTELSTVGVPLLLVTALASFVVAKLARSGRSDRDGADVESVPIAALRPPVYTPYAGADVVDRAENPFIVDPKPSSLGGRLAGRGVPAPEPSDPVVDLRDDGPPAVPEPEPSTCADPDLVREVRALMAQAARCQLLPWRDDENQAAAPVLEMSPH